jgi:hypothetical protein
MLYDYLLKLEKQYSQPSIRLQRLPPKACKEVNSYPEHSSVTPNRDQPSQA